MIKTIEGIDSPFKYPMYNKTSHNIDDIRALMAEAIYSFNPVRIKYYDLNKNISFRNLAFISYYSDAHKQYGDSMWENYYYPGKRSKIVAQCLLRDEHREFYIHKILTIELFDAKFVEIGQIPSLSGALWYYLVKNDLKLCERISKLTPSFLKETNLISSANFAHYLLMSDRKEEAIEIYKRFEGRQLSDKRDWKEKIVNDFFVLKNVDDFKEKIDKAVEELGWK
jgi:hypothetical protein